MDYSLYHRILGSLAGTAIGDAMGAATELLTEEEIVKRFGAPVESFRNHHLLIPMPEEEKPVK